MADPYIPYRREVRPPLPESLGEHTDRQFTQIEQSLSTLDQRQSESELQAVATTETLNDTVASITELNTVVTEQGEAFAESISEVNARVDSTEASISSEVSTRATADGALSSRLDTVEANYQDAGDVSTAVNAAVSSEATARANADSALSTSITGLTATLGATNALINGELNASASREAAMAHSLLSMTAKVSDNSASITSERTSRVTSEEAQARSLDSLTVRMGTAEASITDEATVRASADSALSSRVTTVEASYQNASQVNSIVNAAVATEATARANGDSANASSITSLTTTVSGHTSSLTTQSSAISTLQGRTAAFWQVDAVAGGRAQLKVYADANGGGGVDIIGDVKISGNLVVDGTITNGKLGGSSVSTDKLQNNAATVPVTAFTAALTGFASGAWTTIQSVTTTTTGAPVLVVGSFYYEALRAGNTVNNQVQLLRDGTAIYGPVTLPSLSVNDGSGFKHGYKGPISLHMLDTPGAGSHTYTLQVIRDQGSLDCSNRSISALELKK